MAENAHDTHAAHHAHTESPSGGTGGTMDITDHVKTWLAFWNAAKYSTLGVIILVALMAYFRTHNGYN